MKSGKYKVGMYGGSFCPLHIGHVEVMRRAAKMCEELYIVLSYSRSRDQVPMEYRYRWILASTVGFSNIHIICVEDTATSKEEYNDGYWEKGRDEIIRRMGKRPDVVFCGSDYPDTEDNIYKKLYGCDVMVADRGNAIGGSGAEHVQLLENWNSINVSSSDIRGNEIAMWDYLPAAARPYYVKNIYIVGVESSGKSTLAKRLADYFDTNFVSEVGRDVCEVAGGEEYMVPEDFFEIMIRHKAAEIEARKHSNKLLFIDTEVLTTLYYSKFLVREEELLLNLGHHITDDSGFQCAFSHLADGIASFNSYDLVLFLEPGSFVQDGTRNEDIGANLEKYSRKIQEEFISRGINFISVGGDYEEKFQRAIQVVEKTFFQG